MQREHDHDRRPHFAPDRPDAGPPEPTKSPGCAPLARERVRLQGLLRHAASLHRAGVGHLRVFRASEGRACCGGTAQPRGARRVVKLRNSVLIKTLVTLVLALALGAFAGCGDDEERHGSGGTEPTLNTAVPTDVDEADPTRPGAAAGRGGARRVRGAAHRRGHARAFRRSAAPPGSRPRTGSTPSTATSPPTGRSSSTAPATATRPAEELIFDKQAQVGLRGQGEPADRAVLLHGRRGDLLPGHVLRQGAAAVRRRRDRGRRRARERAPRPGPARPVRRPRIISAQLELQADCLAGVWAKTVYERGLLEEGDIGEILGLVEIAGDPEGFPINAPGAHGNSAMRQDFFDQGYEGGAPGSCPVPQEEGAQPAAAGTA